MEVNGYRQLFGYHYFSKYIFLCSAGVRNSYRFERTWGWVNDDRIFIFGWTVPLNIWTHAWLYCILMFLLAGRSLLLVLFQEQQDCPCCYCYFYYLYIPVTSCLLCFQSSSSSEIVNIFNTHLKSSWALLSFRYMWGHTEERDVVPHRTTVLHKYRHTTL